MYLFVLLGMCVYMYVRILCTCIHTPAYLHIRVCMRGLVCVCAFVYMRVGRMVTCKYLLPMINRLPRFHGVPQMTSTSARQALVLHGLNIRIVGLGRCNTTWKRFQVWVSNTGSFHVCNQNAERDFTGPRRPGDQNQTPPSANTIMQPT